MVAKASIIKNYAKADAAGKVDIICKNYSNFIGIVDGYTEGLAELSSAMGKIIPTANAYGVSLDPLCAGYAIMTANGVATVESTTYMNSMLNELGKSGTNVYDILKEKMGSSFAELMNSG